jgi:hypothetical protein
MADNFENELNRSEKLLKERLIKAGKIARDINDKAFKELLSTINEYSNAIDDISEKLVEQLVSYDKIKLSTRQFGDALKSTLPFIKENKDLTSKLTQLYTTNNKLATSLVRNQEDLIVGQLSTQDIAKDIAKVKQQQLNIELAQRDISQEIEILNREAVGLQGEELENIAFKLEALKDINEQLEAEKENTQSISDNLSEQAKSAAEIETKVGIGGKLLEGFKKIPILGDILDVGGAKEAMQAAAASGASGFSTIGTGIKALGPSLKAALGPLGLILVAVEAVKALVDAMFEADKRITDISKNLSISKESAEGIYDNIIATKKSTDDLRYATTELNKAFSELADLSDFTNIATRDQLVTQVKLTKLLGLQVDEALQLQEIFAVNNIEAEKGVDTVYDQIAAFANQNKIVADGRKILKEISKTSNLVKLNFRGSTSELTKTVLEAKKLGLSLDQVNKVADSLLNFEQSISSELEAELLLGRDINLEKAREFALTNDIAGLTQEIANQGITAEKFSRMNRIQQEAIAKTLGMSANELADSLYKQEIINKTAGNYTKELRENAKQLKERAKETGNIKDLEKAIKLEKEAAAVEQGILDGKSLEEAQKRASAEEKFNAALERAKELFSDMARDGGLFDKMIGVLENIFGITEQKSKKSLEEQGYTIKEGSGLFGTGAFKSNQIFKDGKRLDVVYGSKGIQALEEKYGKAEEADDFIIRPGQKPLKFRKDDIVIGGTNLGGGGNGEVVSLLKELISAVTSGGDVYLDGTKVGTAMSVSTYKVQ